MTMKGNFSLLGKSYFLPFMLIGVLFYFIGSVQGSFQAFRFTNYVWHFTDFNVAHSHMTMYGITGGLFFLLDDRRYAQRAYVGRRSSLHRKCHSHVSVLALEGHRGIIHVLWTCDILVQYSYGIQRMETI